jgi:hypothetical protein
MLLANNYKKMRAHLEALVAKDYQPETLSQGLHDAAAAALALLTPENAPLAVAMGRLCFISQMIREGAMNDIEWQRASEHSALSKESRTVNRTTAERQLRAMFVDSKLSRVEFRSKWVNRTVAGRKISARMLSRALMGL